MATPATIDRSLKVYRKRIQTDMSNRLVGNNQMPSDRELREVVEHFLKQYENAEGRIDFGERGRDEFIRGCVNDFAHLGPLEDLLAHPDVTEIMVNGYDQVFVEMGGKLVEVECDFDDDDHVKRVIDRIVQTVHRHIDEQTPYVDARLKDGSRVNATIPPISVDHPTLTIRKFSERKLGWQDYINWGAINEPMVEFLSAAVEARCNVLVTGGTGSGKTTLLNVLSNEIPEDQRIITIEDAAELQLAQEHVVRFETRRPNSEGAGAVTIHDLIVNSLRMRPDRIIVGECRSEEAIEMLQAMNTGHDGSLTTIHANSPTAAFERLETMVLQGNAGLPSIAIKRQIATAIDIIVHTQRLLDGSRKVVSVGAVGSHLEGDAIPFAELFRFDQHEVLEHGDRREVQGKFVGCGMPTDNVLEKFASIGKDCDPHWFL